MSSKMITLISSDKQSFEVDEKVAELSEIIKNSIEDTGTPENGIPLPNVDSKTLAKVTEYLNKHLNEAGNDDELKKWDNQFMSNNSNCNTLFELILAANYMNIKGLLDLTCQTVADDIKGKSVEEVRKYFNITNDFTPEEEAQARKENQWAFE